MKFRIYKTSEGFRWSMHAANGKNLASGEAYDRRASMVSMLRKNITRGDPALEAELNTAIENMEVYEDNPFEEQ